MAQALHGIRVLDFSRVLAGPYCTMVLGDLGADIVKLEPPGGDDTRAWGPPFAGDTSAYYLSANRNKRSLCVDLKTTEGLAIIHRLAATADVVVENFRPGKAAELGIGYEDLRALQQGIVYCSISGYGQNGPYRDLPGYDFVIQAMSGLMSITGDPEGGPMKVGVAVGDVFTGLFSAIAILAALQHRRESGQGQYIDMALMDAQVATLANVASNYLVGGLDGRRMGNAHPNIVPYQTFLTADGEFAVAVGTDAQFRRLCVALDRPELAADERFTSNASRVEHRAILVPLLADGFKNQPRQHWMQALTAAEVPCGPIQTMPEVFADPQVLARGMVVTTEHPTAGPVNLVGSPLHLSETPPQVRRHPPVLGEHTSELLAELGYSRGDTAHLIASQIVKQP